MSHLIWQKEQIPKIKPTLKKMGVPDYPSIDYLEKVYRKGRIDKFLGTELYFEPKYDGTCIRLIEYQGKIIVSTRGRWYASKEFIEGFAKAYGEKIERLIEILSNGIVIFCELYGTANTPSGIHKNHSREWDYVIFDAYSLQEKKFLRPEEAENIVAPLKYVQYIKDEANGIGELIQKAEKYSKYEGVVIKKYSKELHATKWKPIKTEGQLPPTEILGAINKIHAQIRQKIHDTNIALPLIKKQIQQEATKHGLKPPKEETIIRLYNLYRAKLRTNNER